MYDYKKEKEKIFTDSGQRNFIKVRDSVKECLKKSGAFMMYYPLKNINGDSWLMMAYIDRLVELGEIREITTNETAGQDRVFVEINNDS